jgi:hypothetical protein
VDALRERRSLVVAVVALLTLAAGLASRGSAAENKEATVDKVPYQGWKDNLRLSNGQAELIVTLDVGPRVISYRLAGGKNVFNESREQLGKSGEDKWQGRGGHRLWIGPEDLTRTYAPDNGAVKYQQVMQLHGMPPGTVGVRLAPAPLTEYGLQKEMEVYLAPTGSQVTVVHRITNTGREATELAPWALTVLAPGGVEVVPLPPKRPHPGDPKNAHSPADFAPNQVLVLWSFFDFKDPRWDFGTRYITLRQDSKRGPTKIGLAHRLGWIGYLNDGNLFVKRIGYQDGKTYPDHGCNFETFTNEEMLEMESLGPMVKLAPEQSVEHIEHWGLFGDVKPFSDEAGIDANILPRLRKE